MGWSGIGRGMVGVGLLAYALVFGSARAGTISLAWDPVVDSDLAGYIVFWGDLPGQYTEQADVGNVTSTTIQVGDCATKYIAVKAYDREGNRSVEYSNEISGWARPEIETLTPSRVERGWSAYLDIEGTNFKPGTIGEVSWPGVVVNNTQASACGAVRMLVSVANNATEGFATITLIQPDRVYGEAVGILEISRDKTPPGRVPRSRREGDVR